MMIPPSGSFIAFPFSFDRDWRWKVALPTALLITSVKSCVSGEYDTVFAIRTPASGAAAAAAAAKPSPYPFSGWNRSRSEIPARARYARRARASCAGESPNP